MGWHRGAESGTDLSTPLPPVRCYGCITKRLSPVTCVLKLIPRAFALTPSALVDAIPPIRGKRGRPKRRPACVVGDRGYQWKAASDQLRRMRIRPLIAERRTEHGSGLGKQRWVVERTSPGSISTDSCGFGTNAALTSEGFVSIACSLICFRALRGTF